MNKVAFYVFWLITLVISSALVWKMNPPPNNDGHASVGGKELAFSYEQPIAGPIQPIPMKINLNIQKVELGRKLFHDPQLSQTATISCSTCHNLETGGTDHRAVSLGMNGEVGDINSPTVFNSHFNFKQFWDGRAESLEDQMDGPIESQKEMGSTWENVIQRLKKNESYVKEFRALYPEGIQEKNIKDAIAIFEKSLITPNSRFDQFLRGNETALNAKEKRGYQLFQDLGCVVCHQGVNIGGNTFQTMGKLANYFEGKEIKKSDLGRFNVTGNERDRHKFKVPSLRNIALTKPYFHDGSAKTLEEAVSVMARYQLGYELSGEEIDSIISFLKILTGEYQGKLLR